MMVNLNIQNFMTFDALNSETNKLKAQGKLMLRNVKHENRTEALKYQ